MTLCNSTAEAMPLLPWWRVGVSRAPPDAQNQPSIVVDFERLNSSIVVNFERLNLS